MIEKIKHYLPIVDQGLVSGSTFFASFTVAIYSTPEDLGLFSIAINIIIFTGILQAALVTRPMNVIGNILNDEDKVLYFTSGTRLQFNLIILTVLLCFVVLNFWQSSASEINILFTLSVCFLCLSFQIREYFRFYYLSKLNFLNATKISFIYFISVALLCVIVVVLRKEIRLDSLTIIFVLSISALIPFVQYLFKENRPKIKFTSSSYKFAIFKNVKYSKWELFGSLSNYGYLGLIPILLVAQNKMSDAGGFTAAKTIFGPLQILIFGAYNIMVPKATSLVKNNLRESNLVLFKTLIFVFVISSCVILPIVLFPAIFLEIIYGKNYEQFASVLQIFSFYYLILGMTTTFHALVLSRQNPLIKGISQFIGMVSCLTFVFIYYPRLDALYGAIATLMGESATLISVTLLFILFPTKK